MEEQVKVPLMKTSLDTAKALNVALSVAAVDVPFTSRLYFRFICVLDLQRNTSSEK